MRPPASIRVLGCVRPDGTYARTVAAGVSDSPYAIGRCGWLPSAPSDEAQGAALLTQQRRSTLNAESEPHTTAVPSAAKVTAEPAEIRDPSLSQVAVDVPRNVLWCAVVAWRLTSTVAPFWAVLHACSPRVFMCGGSPTSAGGASRLRLSTALIAVARITQYGRSSAAPALAHRAGYALTFGVIYVGVLCAPRGQRPELCPG